MKMNLKGQHFGRWFVLREMEPNETSRLWECQCQCGTVRTIPQGNLRSGASTSCGCYRDELFTHMVTNHGDSDTRLYRIHSNMMNKVENTHNAAYKHFREKNIRIMTKWYHYPHFRQWAWANGYTEETRLCRIDKNDSFYPANCEWRVFKNHPKPVKDLFK